MRAGLTRPKAPILLLHLRQGHTLPWHATHGFPRLLLCQQLGFCDLKPLQVGEKAGRGSSTEHMSLPRGLWERGGVSDRAQGEARTALVVPFPGGRVWGQVYLRSSQRPCGALQTVKWPTYLVRNIPSLRNLRPKAQLFLSFPPTPEDLAQLHSCMWTHARCAHGALLSSPRKSVLHCKKSFEPGLLASHVHQIVSHNARVTMDEQCWCQWNVTTTLCEDHTM